MLALANAGQNWGASERPDSLFEGNLRATGVSEISGESQPAASEEVTESAKTVAERVGFEPTVEFPPQHLSRVPLSSAQSPLRGLKGSLGRNGREP